MPIRKENMSFPIQASRKYIAEVVDPDWKEDESINSRSEAYQKAMDYWIASRRNRGKFKRIK